MANEESKVITAEHKANSNNSRRERPFAFDRSAPKNNIHNKKRDGFRNNAYDKNKDEFKNQFKQETLEVRKVCKTTTGGKEISFGAVVVIGNGAGLVGFGKGKDKEVLEAINKAVNDAYKKIVRIALDGTTIFHDVRGEFCATTILFKRAKKGTGCIACNALKVTMHLAGVKDLVAKVIGSSNLRNILHATLEAIRKLESPRSIAMRRGKSLEEIFHAKNAFRAPRARAQRATAVALDVAQAEEQHTEIERI